MSEPMATGLRCSRWPITKPDVTKATPCLLFVNPLSIHTETHNNKKIYIYISSRSKICLRFDEPLVADKCNYQTWPQHAINGITKTNSRAASSIFITLSADARTLARTRRFPPPPVPPDGAGRIRKSREQIALGAIFRNHSQLRRLVMR